MSSSKLTQFTVTGKGDFPLDMLRHDCCYPVSTEDAFNINADLGQSFTPRSVRLETRLNVTPLRWASFGWTVTDETVMR